MPASKTQQTFDQNSASGGKPPARSSQKGSKGTSQSARKGKSRAARGNGLGFTLSAERVFDLAGIGLALFGLFLGLILFSISRSSISDGVRGFFDAQVGLGIYLLPLAFLWVGGWMMLRKVESMPPFSLRKAGGALLGFLFVLAALAAFMDMGGSMGRGLVALLVASLGDAGALVGMGAMLVVSLMLLFDLSMGWIVGGAWGLLAAGFGALANMAKRASQRGDGWEPDEMPFEDGFLPVEPVYDGTVRPVGAQVGDEAPALEHGRPVRLEPARVIWNMPKAKDLLVAGNPSKIDDEAIEERALLIEQSLKHYGAPGKVVNVSRGPTVTQFGVEPGFVETRGGKVKVRVNKIASLADDLAMALAAPRIRIQAPVPGHSFVGIEVPNSEMVMVTLRDIVESPDYQSKRKPLSFALGRDVSGKSVVVDLATMPHLLIAGTTGSGKSVCVNAMLSCLLLNNSPDDLRLILVDPKRVELTGYNGIPHLLSSVIVETERVLGALQWMSREMDKRYKTFSMVGARNIDDYNRKVTARGERKLPYIVVVIDELADLMMVAPDETEHTITRLAQLARATGIHLVLATQRPSVNVMTGLIKSNIPARIAFAVSSNTDSRVILDTPGAERLLGKGDMLYMDPAAPEPVRLQGVYVSDPELHALVDFWSTQGQGGQADTVAERVDAIGENLPLKQTSYLMDEDITAKQGGGDVLFDEAVAFVRQENRASVSMLQRKFRIGYTRASRLIETMEEKKVVGAPKDATGIRPILWDEEGSQGAD